MTQPVVFVENGRRTLTRLAWTLADGDPLEAVGAAATLTKMLHPERVARLTRTETRRQERMSA